MDLSNFEYTNRYSIEELRWRDYQLGINGTVGGVLEEQNQNLYLEEEERRRMISNDHMNIPNNIRFEDGMIPDLFQEADPLKTELFFKWIKFRNRVDEVKLRGYTIYNPFTFFSEAFCSRVWLDTDHVDLAMLLLRQRQIKYPTSFGRFNRAILDSNFHELLQLGSVDVTKEYVEGNVFEYGKKWNGCTHLYYPVCTRQHWIAVEVVFSESTMFIYDCDPNVISMGELEQDLKFGSVLIPKLAKLADISTQDTLKIVRVDGLPRQPIPGDCGVYTIKYIEFLSIQQSVDCVDDRYMLMWRRKLAVDLFNQSYDP